MQIESNMIPRYIIYNSNLLVSKEICEQWPTINSIEIGSNTKTPKIKVTEQIGEMTTFYQTESSLLPYIKSKW